MPEALRRRSSALILALGMTLGAPSLIWAQTSGTPAPAQPFKVQDDRGREVQFLTVPRRIVSLLPSLTETVCALQACDRLVGTDQFSNWPQQVRSLPKLGGLEDAQVERIVALRPDLVLASRSARVVPRLEALGIKVLALESDTHADVHSSLRLLGQVLDSAQQADRTWRAIDAAFTQARARVPTDYLGRRVYFEVDDGLYAAGERSFIGATLKRLGLGNIADESLGAFPQLNPELVVRAQPDLIMVSAGNLRDLQQRPGWSALRALKTRQVCSFEREAFELLVRPGPRMGDAALQIADCLVRLKSVSAPRSAAQPAPSAYALVLTAHLAGASAAPLR